MIHFTGINQKMSIDWNLYERARISIAVKRFLKQYGYSLDF